VKAYLPILLVAIACAIASQAAMAQDARVCRESKNNPEALAACDAALVKTQNTDEVKGALFFYRGLRRLMLKQNAGAVDDFTRAIALAPSSFLFASYTNRALAYKAEKNSASALADLTKALEIKPNAIASLIDRAAVETDLGQFSAAAADSDRAIMLDPEGVAPRAGGCSTRALAGSDFDVALTDCNKALAIDPGFPPILVNRGLVYWRRGDYAHALADESDVLAVFPKRASALYIRGLAKVKNGDTDGGKADIDAAAAAQPDIARQYARYGVTP
jgi:tetratricopeptide (TPR) repeat protein